MPASPACTSDLRWRRRPPVRRRHSSAGPASGVADQLDADDLATLDVLLDADDRRSVERRPDVFVAASRQIVIARPVGE